MQSFEYRSVRSWSKEINGTRTWGRKKNFLIRAIDDDATMAAAPVESCQSVALRSPWGRIGSVLYTNKRLHRTRRRFQHISANSLSSAAHKTMNYLAMASRALGGPREPAHAALVTTRPQTYPRGSPGADLPPKKVNNLDPMAPRSRQKRQLPEAPQ